MTNLPKTSVVLAMTADGKIADYQSAPARFGSTADKLHLECQVALADGVLFGAGTLRAYGTTLSVRNAELLSDRKKRGQSPQPLQIVVSASGKIDPQLAFFQQPVPRWLLTKKSAVESWQDGKKFARVLIAELDEHLQIDWLRVLQNLQELGLSKLAILGGGRLVASLLERDLIDELWLTVCPLILGGETAPTPVGGKGWLQSYGKKLKLLSVKKVGDELFLHYSLR